ncbi:hypothetical protein ACQU0X_00875 [Pseudovibrio ascidiaceicola]|uniref:hypothetical protein n=1 Tax=Pseudovibrio ascidiaceicola TaxID=285279 RepID=UPI003D35FBE7
MTEIFILGGFAVILILLAVVNMKSEERNGSNPDGSTGIGYFSGGDGSCGGGDSGGGCE